MSEPLPIAAEEVTTVGIGVRLVRPCDIVFHANAYEWSMFWCGRSYTNDREGAKRHAKSGCKGCRRGQRRFEARARRMAAGQEPY